MTQGIKALAAYTCSLSSIPGVYVKVERENCVWKTSSDLYIHALAYIPPPIMCTYTQAHTCTHMHRHSNTYFKITLKVDNWQLRRVFKIHISNKCFECKHVLKPYNSVEKRQSDLL